MSEIDDLEFVARSLLRTIALVAIAISSAVATVAAMFILLAVWG